MLTHMGQFFKAKREEKGMSLGELAAKTGYNEAELTELEQSEDLFSSLITVLTLGEALEIPKVDLLLLNGTLKEEDIREHVYENKEKFNTGDIRKKELEIMLEHFSEKEKEILERVVSPIYFSDRSDYLKGLWGVVNVIFKNLTEITNDDINKLYAILHHDDVEEE